MFTPEQRQLNLKISKIFEKIPRHQFNQNLSYYTIAEDECGCCVGAHLTQILPEPTKSGYFLHGIHQWYLAMGYQVEYRQRCDRADTLLRICGAPSDPWNSDLWPFHPSEVFYNLSILEGYTDDAIEIDH